MQLGGPILSPSEERNYVHHELLEPHRHGAIQKLLHDLVDEHQWINVPPVDVLTKGKLVFCSTENQNTIGFLILHEGKPEAVEGCKLWVDVKLPPKTAHLVLLGFEKHWRNQICPFELCAVMWRWACQNEIEHLAIECPVGRLAAYRRLGWLPTSLGPVANHWGEPCVPCIIDLNAAYTHLARRALVSPIFNRIKEVCDGAIYW